MLNVNKLPNSIKSLKNMILSLQEKVDVYKKDNEFYKKDNEFYKEENSSLSELVKLLRRQHFAPRSEAINIEQLRLFNEAEEDSEKHPIDKEEVTPVKGHQRNRPKRKPFPDFIPREDVVIELSEEERRCPHDGNIMKKIGEEVSEKLDIIPAQIKVIRTTRIKYGCEICEDCIKIAPVQPQAIPKGIPTAGLLAFIAISKYVDALPLYRIESILSRCRVDISRGTMAHWMIKIAGLISPLINLLEETLLESKYISCDETRVQVLKEEGKKPTTLSYMWVRARAAPEKSRIILFEYDPRKNGDVPVRLLDGFKGYLQVDGADGFNKVCSNPDITRIGCWDHARRRFFNAFKASKKGKGKSKQALDMIKKLYEIEKDVKGSSIEDRYRIRQEKSKPILNQFHEWLGRYLSKTVTSSLLGQAITYTHNEWSTLIRYIDDGNLNISNIFVENAIRPFAIGRKNWLFSASVDGAKASASIYSLVETAKANGHEPYSYLRHVLTEIPKAKILEDFEALLPHNVKPCNLYSGVDA